MPEPASLLSSIELVPLDTLTLYPGNPRKGDQAAIAASLQANQQYTPLVVQKSTGHVLVGNNTLQAARALGWTRIHAVYVDVDDAHARRILVSSNRTADLADYDDNALAEIVASLDGDYDGTGWEEDDAVDILRIAGFLAEDAASFLDDYTGTGGQDEADSGETGDTSSGGQPDSDSGTGTPDGTGYVQVTWLVTPAERSAIQDALDAARAQWDLPTNAAALVALCADWHARHGEPEPEGAVA